MNGSHRVASETLTGCEAGAFAFPATEDTGAKGPDPHVAVMIFVDGEGEVGGRATTSGHSPELPISPLVEATSLSPDPHRAVSAFIHCDSLIKRQSFFGREGHDVAILQPVQSLPQRANPEIGLAIFMNGHDRDVALGDFPAQSVPPSCQPTEGADPQVALLVLGDHED